MVKKWRPDVSFNCFRNPKLRLCRQTLTQRREGARGARLKPVFQSQKTGSLLVISAGRPLASEFLSSLACLLLCGPILQDHSFSRRFLCARKTALGELSDPHLIFIGSSFPVAFCRICVHLRPSLWLLWVASLLLCAFALRSYPSHIHRFFVSFVAFCRICVHLRPSLWLLWVASLLPCAFALRSYFALPN